MNGRRAIVGLSLLCAIVFSAFEASSAVALKHTTAYTCRPEPKPTAATKGFEDEHCTKAVTGTKVAWMHEFIPYDKVTELKVTNNETSSKAIPAKLKGKLAGKAFELQAGGFQSCKTEAWVSNLEFAQQAIGSFCGEFYNVVVKEPAECEIPKGVINLIAGNVTPNVQENGEVEEMWVEFTPAKEEPFASFTFSGAKCSLNGKTAEIEGFARANVMQKETPLDGATLKFTTEETSHSLEIENTVVEFEGTFTPRMLPEVGVAENPVVLTTQEII